jgi:hypothetical protein
VLAPTAEAPPEMPDEAADGTDATDAGTTPDDSTEM